MKTFIYQASRLLSLVAIGLIVGSVPARAQNTGVMGYWPGVTAPTFGSVTVQDSGCIGWADAKFCRAGVNAIAQSNTGLPERHFTRWLSNVFETGIEANGGTGRNFRIIVPAANGVRISTDNNSSDNVILTTASLLLHRASTVQFGVTLGATGTGTQVRTAQQTVPTCATNCGTSPTITGSDTAMRVVMGASGVPASGWIVTFNGTWATAPSCIVTAALAGMVAGKQPIVVATTTTTITVTTNGTAPATSDVYTIICMGVS